jgi:UDP-glucuronate 4-epimerase
MSNIILTGAAGFIGFHVAQQLLEEGHTVVGIDNLNNYYDEKLKQNRFYNLNRHRKFIMVNADINDKEMNETRMNDLFGVADCIIHLAAQAGVRHSIKKPFEYLEANLRGFLNILELARKHDIPKVIYASSSSVYGTSENFPSKESEQLDEPISLYAATKKANELMAHSYSHLYGISTIGLRFFNAYGTWNRPDMALSIFMEHILKNKPLPVFNNGKSKKDFTYVGDIADGVVKCLDYECKNEIFNLGNSKSIDLMTYIKAIEKAVAKKKGISEFESEKDFSELPQGDVPVSCADISKAKKLLKWKPKTKLEDGIENFVDWYFQYYKSV